jgi:hypothetical protein
MLSKTLSTIINFPPARGFFQDIPTPIDKEKIRRNNMIPTEL